jgi:pimeloyl-ACP methyl ester carboxylesterase
MAPLCRSYTEVDINYGMRRHRGIVAAVGLVAIGAGSLVGMSALPAGATTLAGVQWTTCPSYSDAAIESIGYSADQLPAFRALLARSQCGTVEVPLDYAKPHGTKISIAVTRLPAKDQKHRLGSLAVNPGGPGGSGYLMPETLTLRGTVGADLNEKYDLIGFDPRGVGYSSKVDCSQGSGAPIDIPPGPMSEETAKNLYDARVDTNQACYNSDPTFLKQLTTANVARDLNQIREALHQPTLSYFGASWGTLLGAVYRSMFPDTVGRMWLDSVVAPYANQLDKRDDGVAAANQAQATRWAAWAALHNSTYGLGSTADQVLATVKQLRARLDASPVVFSDSTMPLDGNFIAYLASSSQVFWIDSTAAIQAMTTAKSGDVTPPVIAPIISPPPAGTEPPPADAPETINQVTNTAILCNDDTSPHDFASFWSSFQKRLMDYPLTGSLSVPTQMCAGWPTPSHPFQLRASRGSLQMSGHLYENVTPYPWVGQMRSTVGGTVFTVDDDRHGSAAFVPGCGSHITAYFMTGRPDSGECTGADAPPDSAAAKAESQLDDLAPATSDTRKWHLG